MIDKKLIAEARLLGMTAAKSRQFQMCRSYVLCAGKVYLTPETEWVPCDNTTANYCDMPVSLDDVPVDTLRRAVNTWLKTYA